MVQASREGRWRGWGRGGRFTLNIIWIVERQEFWFSWSTASNGGECKILGLGFIWMGTDLIYQEKRCAYRRVHLHLQKGHPPRSSPSQNPSRHGEKRERLRSRGWGTRGRTAGETTSSVSSRGLERGIFDIWVRLSCNSKFRDQFGRFNSSGANLSMAW
jgi:hypothetical protein